MRLWRRFERSWMIVVESSLAQMHLQHFGEFVDDQVDQPHFLLHVQFVFQTPESFVPSFLSSCCSVLKSPYLSPSSEISNAFVLVLTFQQALLLLDHYFVRHPRGLLLLPTARTEFDLLERATLPIDFWLWMWYRNFFDWRSTEALASKFLSLSTGIFCQQIPEYEVQVSCSNVHHVELILVFLELLWQLMRKLRDHAFLLKLQGVRASQRLSNSSNSSWLLHGISTSCISFSRIRPSRMALNSHAMNRYGGSHCSSYRKL
ncbi:hypothetical protein M5K25_024148 [Dendrobium thyrsiflorum]|uniref:Uncharacterized protein n=1 Tax=Dendrobium thyrsiflorum TaxID=117978 RepID=A0ABD0U1L2_DENTH